VRTRRRHRARLKAAALFESIKVVAADSPEPLRIEFLRIIETQRSHAAREACGRLFERMPLPEANFFGIVINIQQKSGGNLSEALGNLSKVLATARRGREDPGDVDGSQGVAGIIGSLPPIVMLLVYMSTARLHLAVVDPPHGQFDAWSALVWMSMAS